MEQFRYKSQEEIDKQVKSAEDTLGQKIIPPNESEISGLSEKYPGRYKAFVEALRLVKSPLESHGSIEVKDKVIELAKYFRKLNNLQDYVKETCEGKEKVLVPRQIETIEKISRFLEKGLTEGHVSLPTGIGKTVIFSRLLEVLSRNNRIKALVIGPTKIILHQNKWKLEAFGDVKSGRLYGSEKDIKQDVTVTTYASLRNNINNGVINPLDFDILILDEAHRALGDETVKAIEAFPESTIKIGFTATPEFHEEKTVADILPHEIDSMPVREAIEDGLLAGLKVFLVPTKKDISELERKGGDYEEEKLAKIINTEDRNNLVVDAYVSNKLFNGKLGIVYCANRDHAKAMNQAFVKKGVPSAYMGGELSDIEREEILLKYKQGEIKILCNVRVLVEGFDETEAEVCINACPTMSKVVAEQRGGRILRRSAKKSNKIGYVVEVFDEFGKSANTPVLFSEIAGSAEIIQVTQVEEEELQDQNKRNITSDRHAWEGRAVEVTDMVIDDPELIMKITNKNARLRFDKMFEFAPLGWSHSRLLAHELGVKEGKIREYAESQKEQHPEWFRTYLTATDILTQHYHPELTDTIRRMYVETLKDTITVREYAETHSIDDKKARNIIEAAKGDGLLHGKKIGDTIYYPKKLSYKVIGEQEKEMKIIAEKEIQETDDAYWNDDEKTEEEKEHEYWSTFSVTGVGDDFDTEISEIQDGELTVPFDEEVYQDLFQPDMLETMSEFQKKAIFEAIDKLVDQRIKDVIKLYFFKDMKVEEIGRKYGITGTRVNQLIHRGLRMIRNQCNLGKIFTVGTEKSVLDEFESKDRISNIDRLENIPFEILVTRMVRYMEQISNSKDNKEHIASWETEYYQLFETVMGSLLPSDREVIELIAQKGVVPDLEYESSKHRITRIKSILDSIMIRSILDKNPGALGKEFKRYISPDGKAIDIYDMYSLRQEVISIENIDKLITEYEKDSMNGQFSQNDREYYGLKAKKEKLNKKKYSSRLKELGTYLKWYKERFNK